MELALYPHGLIAYVIVMIYIILGCGFTFPALAKWIDEVQDRLSYRTRYWEVFKAILSWPWFDIKKVRDKYSS